MDFLPWVLGDVYLCFDKLAKGVNDLPNNLLWEKWNSLANFISMIRAFEQGNHISTSVYNSIH
jgi:hypothetical protein